MRILTRSRSSRRTGLLIAFGASACLVASGLDASAASAAPEDVPPPTSVATTMYIDCSRGTDGDGSMDAPRNSLAAANAHAAFQPGDAILLKRTSHCAGRLHPKGSGAKGAPIVIGAYGKGARPVIDGNGTADQTGTVMLTNQSYWTIQDLAVTNRTNAAETRVHRSAVMLKNSAGGRLPGITVQRLRVSQVVSNLWPNGVVEPRDYGGISAITDPGTRQDSGFDGLRILNNSVTDVGRSGIFTANHGWPTTSDRDVRISGNRVTRSRGDGVVIFGTRNGRIDHNVAARTASFWPCKQCGPINPWTANAAIWTTRAKDIRIDHNEAYGTKALGGDGEGLDVDMSTTNVTVEYNYSHDNEGGGILLCGSQGAVVRFNIFQNNRSGQITFINSIPAKNTKIYNNTIYSEVGNQARTIRSFGDAPSRTNRVSGISFFNNLVFSFDDSGYYLWPTKPKVRNNTYVGVHGLGEPADVSKGWDNPGVSAPGRGTKGFASLTGYRMGAGMKNANGFPIPQSVTRDFFGKRIDPLRPPRGAAG